MKAIVDMPNPTDVPGVQRLLGLAQYLAKFLPHLSDITKPLRDLTRNDTEWIWESSQQNALDTLKKAVASTPVLRYYNLADEVTIQCDASQSGLGAALMQNGQPVAYASRALTPPETRKVQRGVKLNVDKFKLRQEEVRFIGHVATSDGLSIDPTKVKAIVDMPNPTDVPGVQRLLGLAQYMAKFLPHLSDITKPLQDLTRNDTEWMWESSQQNALDTLKKAVASTPVLRYYNLADEVTIQCDASQSGLGAALMQNGQPVAYASRALTPPETRKVHLSCRGKMDFSCFRRRQST